MEVIIKKEENKAIEVASEIAIAISRGQFNNENFKRLDKYLSSTETPIPVVETLINGVRIAIDSLINNILESKKIIVPDIESLSPEQMMDDEKTNEFLIKLNALSKSINKLIKIYDECAESPSNMVFHDIYRAILDITSSTENKISSSAIRYEQMVLCIIHNTLCNYIFRIFK